MHPTKKVSIIIGIISFLMVLATVTLMTPFAFHTNYSAPKNQCSIDTTNLNILRYIQWYRKYGDIDTMRREFYYSSLKSYLLKQGFDECEATVYAELPSVESNWRNDLVSSAGAIGIWQVMPSLGTAYKKTIHDLKDPAIGTFVSVEYLKALKKIFGNDVAKVLYAYNTGPGIVTATLKEYGTNNIWVCTFKSRETQEFAAKVLGAAYYMNYDTDRK